MGAAAASSDERNPANRSVILAGLMLSIGLVAMDATIVATAGPTITSDLGSSSLWPWVFSIYLLGQTLTIPIYGKLSDLFGRKPLLLCGIGLFLLGSVLCGLSTSMLMLVICRGLQGLGAGAVQPVTMTIAGDIYTVEERAQIQGYLSSVWGVAAIIGPTLGGFIVQYGHWPWVFFINLPLGAAALYMVVRHYHEAVERKRHRIDYPGAALLAGGVGALMLALMEGGSGWPWLSVPGIGLVAGGILLLLAFIRVEQGAAEPLLPLWIFGRRMLSGANLAALILGTLVIGLSIYIPSYVQGVLGGSALVAGFALAVLSIGWPLASTVSGRLYLRIGFRNTAFVGAGFGVMGGAVLLSLNVHSTPLHVALGTFLLGCCMGLSTTPLVVGIQSVVGWSQRGVVTGTNVFMRQLGSTLGAAIYGGVVNAALFGWIAHAPSALRGQLPTAADATAVLVSPQEQAAHPAVVEYVRAGLNFGIHHMFWSLLIAVAIAFAFEWIMPARAVAITADAAD